MLPALEKPSRYTVITVATVQNGSEPDIYHAACNNALVENVPLKQEQCPGHTDLAFFFFSKERKSQIAAASNASVKTNKEDLKYDK